MLKVFRIFLNSLTKISYFLQKSFLRILFWVLTQAMPSIVPCQASPGDIQELSSAQFQLPGVSVFEKFLESSRRINFILNRFKPVDIQYSKYEVLENGPLGMPRMQFLAELVVPPIQKTGWFIGDAQSVLMDCIQPFQEQGIRFILNLQESDTFLAKKVSSLFIEMCVLQNSDHAIISYHGKRIEGEKYVLVLGPLVDKILTQQIPAMIEAFKEEFYSGFTEDVHISSFHVSVQ